jgi:enoyl-CoA hydratase/carnithine racemase
VVDKSFDTIEYALEDRTAVITLNRPDRLNAFSGEMAMDLKAAVARSVEDSTVRAIVLTGAGRAFCAGADLGSIAKGIPPSGDPKVIAELDAHFTSDVGPDVAPDVTSADRLGYFVRTKKPIIAAVNGAAAGMGLVLSLYADIRIASENAFFMTAQGQRGLIAEHGMAWLLQRSIGQAQAMDMLISSRRVPAAEAKAMGLINEVVPAGDLQNRALAYAHTIAATMSPRSVAVMKAQLWRAQLQTFNEALDTALAETRLAASHPDFREGVASFQEKRPPRFSDL